MDKLVIEGGHPLEGTVKVCGSKNAVLPVMAAALLTDQTLRIANAPLLADVDTMMAVLRDLDCQAERNADGVVEMRSGKALATKAAWNNVRKMRGSVAVLGPLLARTQRAEVSLPGGCVFGVRPIDVHLKGMEALGARVRIEHGYVIAEAPRGLKGAEMFLGSAFGSSVLGTANVMMAATLAKGRTVIQGAACEPEVEDLGRCLIAMGARIQGLGSPRVEIEGVPQLGGTTWNVIPDRIEAGTYVVAGAMAGGRVRVEGCRPDHLAVLLDRLWEARVPFDAGEDWIETQPYHPRDPARRPRSTDVTTLPYPGFPTDLQAQWMALMTLADGISVITECIYPDRYMHIAELTRLGAQVRRQGTAAIVQGTPRLSGAQVMASDLRASAALVLAGLVAEGTTEVHRVYHIDRGYERIEERLQSLGAVIQRVDEKEQPLD
ncbi:MAG: UDP-N-acetylglucosamine 1-carboxyvinyltransferase [Planctomycetota bacterium]